jgi:hypothetical protein
MTLTNSKQKYRNMKTNLRRSMLPAIAGCAITLAVRNVFGLGGDYPNDRAVNEPSWPEGMKNLVNVTNRVGGLFVNDRDMFFFSGTVSNLASFLGDYSKIQAIEKHRLILHDGIGEAYSLGGGNRRPCDWSLDGYGNGWKNGIMTNYVLEVHFWTGGKIALDQLTIPQNVEVTKFK